MDKPNNLSEVEQEILKLEAQLHEAAAAERFFDSASGRLVERLIATEVTNSLNKITGDDYKKDHTGYINELAWLQANKRLLRKLQIAASPIRRNKIQERLDARGEEFVDERKSS